jgi:hypothetical protein
MCRYFMRTGGINNLILNQLKQFVFFSETPFLLKFKQ